MKIKAESEGQTVEVEFKRTANHVSATIDGRHYEVKVEGQKDDYLIFNRTAVSNCHIEEVGPTNEYRVHLRARSYLIKLVDPKRLGAFAGAGSHHHGSAEIIATMPGKVVKVLVEAGSSVEAGAGVVVVEAMKMQNEMKAPKAGTVITLNATPGATVNAGEVLAVIE